MIYRQSIGWTISPGQKAIFPSVKRRFILLWVGLYIRTKEPGSDLYFNIFRGPADTCENQFAPVEISHFISPLLGEKKNNTKNHASNEWLVLLCVEKKKKKERTVSTINKRGAISSRRGIKKTGKCRCRGSKSSEGNGIFIAECSGADGLFRFTGAAWFVVTSAWDCRRWGMVLWVCACRFMKRRG